MPLFCEAVFPPIKTLRKEQRNDDAWRFFVSSCVVGSADARAEKTNGGERFFVGCDCEYERRRYKFHTHSSEIESNGCEILVWSEYGDEKVD